MAVNRFVTKGTKGGYVVANFITSGAVYLNSASVTIGANTGGETVNELFLTHAHVSAANGVVFNVARGANTVINLSGTGSISLQDTGIALEVGGESAANVVVTKLGTGVASLVLKFHKRSSITGGSIY